MTNAQRALWTFLFYTLVGPFIGALLLMVVMPAAALVGLAPELQGYRSAGYLPLMGRTALFAYVWAAPPAGLAALGLLPFVFRSGAFGWIAAATAGVLAFAVAAMVLAAPPPDLIAYLAFLAGVVSLICRWALIRIGVLATG